MADVFISYAQADRTHAERLAAALGEEGLTVWWDPHVEPGDDFDEVIEAQLDAAHCVVVLWSKRSRRSRYVKGEARFAMAQGKLVPAFIEHVTPPFDFHSIQGVFLDKWDGDTANAEYQKLVRRIARRVEEAALQTEPKPDAGKASQAEEETAKRKTKQAPVSSTTKVTAPSRALGTIYRDVLKDGSEGPEMVVMPAGHFWMGSPDDEPERFEWEGPRHRIEISRPFALGRTAVTFDHYDRFAKATSGKRPSDQDWGRSSHPVIEVSWDDAVAYAEWLCEQTGRRYRLPTEAEWEYACRAGTETPFYTGDCIHTDQANYDGNYDYNDCGANTGIDRKKTVPTGSLPANPWGLHEMHGNVWEWVQDCWHDDYSASPPTDGSAWEKADGGECGRRLVRGGAWDSEPRGLRMADRDGSYADTRYGLIGFRLAQDME